jgi:hypothetical protein
VTLKSRWERELLDDPVVTMTLPILLRQQDLGLRRFKPPTKSVRKQEEERIRLTLWHCLLNYPLPRLKSLRGLPLREAWRLCLGELTRRWFEDRLMGYQPRLPIVLLDGPALPEGDFLIPWRWGHDYGPARHSIKILAPDQRRQLAYAVVLRYRMWALSLYGDYYHDDRLWANRRRVHTLAGRLAEETPIARHPDITEEDPDMTSRDHMQACWLNVIYQLAVGSEHETLALVQGLFRP